MPKTSVQNSSATRRRSVRQKPVKKSPAAPADIDDDDVKMPPGYNPSDDSEDEYVPPAKTRRVNLTRSKRKKSSGSDSEPEEEELLRQNKKTKPTKKTIKAVDSSTSKSVTKTTEMVKAKSEIEVKKERLDNIMCPFKSCKEKLKFDGNAKFHLAMHYYDVSAFFNNDILHPEDPDGNGKAIDEKGIKIKYSCPYDRCTRRKMGYKEICVHLATQHQRLEVLMDNHFLEEKALAPEIQRIKKIIFPSLEPEPVKIKSEAVVQPDVEDPDDPDDPAPLTPTSRVIKSSVTTVVKTEDAKMVKRPRVERIMNCFLCKEKDGKNLSSPQEIRYHLSVCAYGTGGFHKYVPHCQGENKQLADIDEISSKRYRYKCTVEGCDMNKGKGKEMGYKALAIHNGKEHGILERWAAESELEGARELHATLKGWREAEGKELPEIPEVKVEEMHTCLICEGADKEGQKLSLAPEKIYSTRYHYAR